MAWQRKWRGVVAGERWRGGEIINGENNNRKQRMAWALIMAAKASKSENNNGINRNDGGIEQYLKAKAAKINEAWRKRKSGRRKWRGVAAAWRNGEIINGIENGENQTAAMAGSNISGGMALISKANNRHRHRKSGVAISAAASA
jgi:hypothetical protein